ncbi:MAG: polyribonucleotide nucleotidyltransferase [Candidatus Buchananbacteria bacterium RIFCSPHIGHO2_01_FULL_44_11]|uniref:Polyribonucleotide nucleotidyltransferase n=1 Tax=Candidatus Buchananbacteria bacterium RIFCSPHIGHO2_01_FULL_44_11 TaxID=1797535 RepID=A0A1G1Y1N1_9BACT|nr:MAG: polyribonucleotide nucleotidyltransferase [Candidatus Buchananbacteria bacterium RIFCSPHIGHO2_01_FULL_44_11]
MSVKTFELDFAGKKLVIETGHFAQQANGSCTVSYGSTVVLATAVLGGIREGVDYFPLSVDYEEKLYAAGKIKGSRWIKREGRPSDEAVLTSRLVDRCIRPLFPKEIKNEVQVILTVLSFDQENDSDIVGLVAASAALAISDIPWGGPLAGIRIGRVEGEWVINPSFEAREKSDLDLVVAAKENKVLMIEAEGKEVAEDVVYSAVEFSLKHTNPIIDLINQVVAAIGRPKADLLSATTPSSEEDSQATDAEKEAIQKTQQWLKENIPQLLFAQKLVTKADRQAVSTKAEAALLNYLISENIGKDRRKKALALLDEAIEKEVSAAILERQQRVDGRKLTEIRPLGVEVGLLPRTHGSALFNRGETQVLSVVTLGAPGDEQFLEGLEVSGKKRYMHHYNFPPYSVGETGRLGSPGRREIGHGALAEKAIKPLLPDKESFPYTIRVVSEVFGSNGSSSMASTCGSALALMDAGVPLAKPVAGIAMGLASDNAGNYKILTDLQDLEDGQGGMDFKIAGTKDGITAIQLDTKTAGLSLNIIKETLNQGLTARLEILGAMDKVIAQPRAELSPFAPRIISFMINPDKIREVIGPGGKIINEIIDATGVQIDIEPEGLVLVTSIDQESAAKAVDWIKNIVREITVGEIFEGKVIQILDFGAIVQILPSKDGMVHISELAPHRVEKVSDVVKIGDTVKVKVINVENGRTSLSIKALLPGAVESSYRPGGHGGHDHKNKFFQKRNRY